MLDNLNIGANELARKCSLYDIKIMLYKNSNTHNNQLIDIIIAS